MICFSNLFWISLVITYAARDKSLIADRLEACLRLGIQKRKLFRLGHCVRPDPDFIGSKKTGSYFKNDTQVNMRDEIEHTQWPDCQTWGKDELAEGRKQKKNLRMNNYLVLRTA